MMDRTYLFVPPEERAEVEALGARWDSTHKRMPMWRAPASAACIAARKRRSSASIAPAARCETNHSSALCAAPIGDIELHSEPDHVFFDIAHAVKGAVTLVPLPRPTRLSGNEHFVID
jgi:hypothetical protein